MVTLTVRYNLIAGHTHIDVLKIDLEGWEFDALATFLVPSPDFTSERPRVPPVSQMLLELHLWNREFPYLLSWWSVLERAGFRAVAREPNLVYQNYNRLQGAELAEVRRRNFRTGCGAEFCDSTRSLMSRRQTFLYLMKFQRRTLLLYLHLLR
jgi:Methyltransferase FkbM domain